MRKLRYYKFFILMYVVVLCGCATNGKLNGYIVYPLNDDYNKYPFILISDSMDIKSSLKQFSRSTNCAYRIDEFDTSKQKVFFKNASWIKGMGANQVYYYIYSKSLKLKENTSKEVRWNEGTSIYLTIENKWYDICLDTNKVYYMCKKCF